MRAPACDDRLAPTRRPDRPCSGSQKWRDLLFVHWPVPVAALRPLVPAALDLDLHEGTAYVGVVPFAMLEVRPWWLPRALGSDFLETNLRTYVHRGGRDPGVFFFSLDAASRLAVWGARAMFGLPYFHADMRMAKDGAALEYEMTRTSAARPRLRARWEVGEPLGPSPEGTLDWFLLERYLLHVERGGRIWSGQVYHTPYPRSAVRVTSLEETLVAAAGLPQPTGAPPLAHFSPGVDVDVFGPWVADPAPSGAAARS